MSPRPLGRFAIPPAHPALPGHFPGAPVVPGALLLDHALALLPAPLAARLDGIARAKLPEPVLPGETVEVSLEQGETLVCRVAGREVARQRLSLRPG